ncbi:MAG TPA: hypothetical protein VGY54_25745 [Polyangiaceae bacterium]|nr:hypothetical protein [Polyangiaceae bacterium]
MLHATPASGLVVLAALAVASPASAAEPAPADAHIDFAPEPPQGKTSEENVAPGGAADEGLEGQGPPMRPRAKGLVLESTLGVMGYAGQFRHVAPLAYWMHAQLGYEVLGWLMLFAEGELALTDTSESRSESDTFAFAMGGFGAGARATVSASERVAFYGQAAMGALGADIRHNALTVLGFRQAESLNPTLGGKLGVDWYQKDRHLALCAALGGRYAQGFAKLTGPSDFPLMWDFGAGLRYAF